MPLVEGDRGRRVIRSTDAPGPGGRPRRAAVGTGAGGAQEGKENPALGARKRRVPAARAARALPPGDSRELIVVVVRGGGERRGAAPLRGGTPRPRRQGLRRRRWSRCPRRARGRVPPGGQWRRPRASLRCRRAPRGHLRVLQWRRRAPQRRLPNPRGRGRGLLHPEVCSTFPAHPRF
jgi:hypothetical protein